MQIYIRFAPDSHHLICSVQFLLRLTLMAWSSLLLSFSSLSFCRPSSFSFPLLSRSIRSLRSRLSLSWGSSVNPHGQLLSICTQTQCRQPNEPVADNTHPSFFSPCPGTSFSSSSPLPSPSSFPRFVAPSSSEPRLLALLSRGTWAEKGKNNQI